MLALFTWLYVIFNPRILNEFAQYPNAVELTSNQNLLHSYECRKAFLTKDYKAFASKDSENEILNFYSQEAKRQKAELFEFVDIREKAKRDIGYVTCFESEQGAKERPTNVVVLLNPNNAGEADIIKTSYSKAPPNAIVILVLRGYTLYP